MNWLLTIYFEWEKSLQACWRIWLSHVTVLHPTLIKLRVCASMEYSKFGVLAWRPVLVIKVDTMHTTWHKKKTILQCNWHDNWWKWQLQENEQLLNINKIIDIERYFISPTETVLISYFRMRTANNLLASLNWIPMQDEKVCQFWLLAIKPMYHWWYLMVINDVQSAEYNIVLTSWLNSRWHFHAKLNKLAKHCWYLPIYTVDLLFSRTILQISKHHLISRREN